jgi:hypothetical protein
MVLSLANLTRWPSTWVSATAEVLPCSGLVAFYGFSIRFGHLACRVGGGDYQRFVIPLVAKVLAASFGCLVNPAITTSDWRRRFR